MNKFLISFIFSYEIIKMKSSHKDFILRRQVAVYFRSEGILKRAIEDKGEQIKKDKKKQRRRMKNMKISKKSLEKMLE